MRRGKKQAKVNCRLRPRKQGSIEENAGQEALIRGHPYPNRTWGGKTPVSLTVPHQKEREKEPSAPER